MRGWIVPPSKEPTKSREEFEERGEKVGALANAVDEYPSYGRVWGRVKKHNIDISVQLYYTSSLKKPVLIRICSPVDDDFGG